MIRVKRIDHVALAVPERDAAIRHLMGLFDLSATSREHVPSQRVDVAFLEPALEPASEPASGATTATALEIVAPQGNEALERFLAKRGAGLHHVCFEVDDLVEALSTLKAAGVKLIDQAPRRGARGHDVAFIHPSATGGVLFELCAASREST